MCPHGGRAYRTRYFLLRTPASVLGDILKTGIWDPKFTLLPPPLSQGTQELAKQVKNLPEANYNLLKYICK